MAKIDPLTEVENIESQTTLTQALADNFDKIESAIDNTVSRDGSAPNYMLADFDMNGKRIINLPSPQSGSDPARWQDVARGLTLTEIPVPDIAGNSGKILSTDGLTLFWAVGAGGSLQAALNLSDVVNKPLARTNLGLGSAATYNTGTAGGTLGLLNANLTFSGSNSFQGTTTFSAPVQMHADSVINTQVGYHPVGYRDVPLISADNSFTLDLSHAGKGLSHVNPAAHTWTIPPNSSVPFPIHTTIVLDNGPSGGNVTIARGAGVTLTGNGSATSQDFVMTANYVRTLYKTDTNTWRFL